MENQKKSKVCAHADVCTKNPEREGGMWGEMGWRMAVHDEDLYMNRYTYIHIYIYTYIYITRAKDVCHGCR